MPATTWPGEGIPEGSKVAQYANRVPQTGPTAPQAPHSHDLTSRPHVKPKERSNSSDRLRLCCRLRWLPRHQPTIDPSVLAADLREDLSVWLARHHVGNTAAWRLYLLLPQSRFCDGVDAQPEAQPLLHPMRSG